MDVAFFQLFEITLHTATGAGAFVALRFWAPHISELFSNRFRYKIISYDALEVREKLFMFISVCVSASGASSAYASASTSTYASNLYVYVYV